MKARHCQKQICSAGMLAILLCGVHTDARAMQQIVAASQPPSTDNASHTAAVTFARPVTVSVQRVPLRHALAAIAANASVRIHYRVEMLAAAERPVTIHVQQQALGTVLQQVLAGTNLHAVSSIPDVVTIKAAPQAATQGHGTIIGRVIHAKTRQPVAGSAILLDEATSGLIVQRDGTFRLSVAPGEHTLRIRALGYARVARKVAVSSGESVVVEVALEPSTSVLDEVIVTGTVSATERREIPNPITVVTAAELEQRGIVRIEQLFRGIVPGVVVREKGTLRYAGGTQGGGMLGEMVSTEVFARGGSTVDGGATPLKTFVDGVEMLNPSYLGSLDMQSVERIEIITGPQAATVYGSGAMGGVMQIFTKKGLATTSADLTLAVRYGMLESNLSNGRTPKHHHSIAVAGGAGAMFSYAGNVSYQYTGQWRPDLFSRSRAASIGVVHARGPFTANGSVSLTDGRNGIQNDNTGNSSPMVQANAENGDWSWGNTSPTSWRSQRIATSASQMFSMSMDYRPLPAWSHHVTVGKNQMDFGDLPQRPRYISPDDTLFNTGSSHGARTTWGYHTTISLSGHALSLVTTTGANGSNGEQTFVAGCMVSKSAVSFVGCSNVPAGVIVARTMDERSWGGFGNVRVGIFDRFFVTAGTRAEYNPNFGDERRIDWTPTVGAAYSVNASELSVKVMASYGKATRPPRADMRKEVISVSAIADPAQYLSQRANPLLRPEYSRGPQGGVEIYVGNRGSLSLNHYQQKITDLIQNLTVDSIPAVIRIPGCCELPSVHRTTQYNNVAQVKQTGWESVGSVSLGPIVVRGTYSWMDSRVLSVHPSFALYYPPGSSFSLLPTHTANVTVSYALRGTSATLSSDWTGASLSTSSYNDLVLHHRHARMRTYIARADVTGVIAQNLTRKPESVTSDLTVSHQLTSRASLMFQMTNVGNNYDTDLSPLYPKLGRQTLLGVTLRTGRGR